MEAAAIRAEHGDPVAAAGFLIPVLDHWEHGGPGLIAQQWDTLRHAVRLLVRLRADDEVLVLQRFFVNAGREPPLSDYEVAGLDGAGGPVPDDGEIVDYARAALRRHC